MIEQSPDTSHAVSLNAGITYYDGIFVKTKKPTLAHYYSLNPRPCPFFLFQAPAQESTLLLVTTSPLPSLICECVFLAFYHLDNFEESGIL